MHRSEIDTLIKHRHRRRCICHLSIKYFLFFLKCTNYEPYQLTLHSHYPIKLYAIYRLFPQLLISLLHFYLYFQENRNKQLFKVVL